MWLWRAGCAVPVLLVTVVACSAPSPPSAQTQALTQWLLSAEEVGDGFTETYKGSAGVEEGKLCPASDYTIPEHGVVRVELAYGEESDRVDVSEALWAVQTGEMDALFAGLEASHDACNGEEWTDYGDVKTFTSVAPPELGDAALAGRLQFGEEPDQGLQEYTVTVRQRDVLAEFTLAHESSGTTGEPVVSDEQFHTIIADALAKLPG